MNFVPLSDKCAIQWDEVVNRSDDSWMCSLRAWQKALVEIPAWALEDKSFLVLENDRAVAAVPLQLTMDGRLCSTAMGPSGPLVEAGMSPEARGRILSAAAEEMRRIGRECDAQTIEVSTSSVSRTSLKSKNGASDLSRHGFEDVSTASWVIDLHPTTEEIFKGLGQKVRWSIREPVKKGYRIRAIGSREEMDLYYDVHCQTYARTGAVAHPKEYFLNCVYDSFIAPGLADGWVAEDRAGRPVGFMNVARFRDAAWYWTSCCRDEDYQNGVYYLLVWHAIEAARQRGMAWFDCGEAFPEAPAGTKERGLSDFKKKFGGKLTPCWKGRIVLRPELVDAPSGARRVLQRLRSARGTVESLVGRPAAEVIALPFRAGLKVVRAARRRHDPQIGFIKPYWHDAEIKLGSGKTPVPGDARQEFVRAFRDKLGFGAEAKIIPTASGRTALELGLRVLKAQDPDRTEVILPSYGCKGTFDPVVNAGLVPVFADVNDQLLADDSELERLFNDRTLAVLLVHLCGKGLDTRRITGIAKQRGIVPIEDHCQNTGGFRPCGEMDISIYAFGMGKNAMATAGGAIVGNIFQEQLNAEAARLAAEPPEAATDRFQHDRARYFGWRGPAPEAEGRSQYGYVAMSPLDAALMAVQLEKLDEIIAGRRANATRLRAKLEMFPEVFHLQSFGNHIHTKLSVTLADRRLMRRFAEWMIRRGIELESMYVPLHLRHFGSKFRRDPLPVCEAIYPRVVNLPVRPNLKEQELEKLETAIEEFGRAHSQS